MFEHRSPPEWQYYLNPWWRQEQVYATGLSKTECQRRLSEGTTRWLGRAVARSLVSSADFTLHRVTFYNNGFKPYVYVSLDDSPSAETIVRLTFSASNWVRFFFIAWYAFMAVFVAIFLASTLGRQPASTIAFPLSVIAVLVAWPVVLNAFGRAIAYGDRRYLAQFLVDELQLKPAQMVSGIAVG